MKRKNPPKNKRWLLATLVLTLFFSSCQKQELPIENKSNDENSGLSGRGTGSTPYTEGAPIILGENKENPYAVKNMEAAWQELEKRGIKPIADAKVYATHYYVKFKPKTSEEYERLHSDSTIGLSDLPIESTVIEDGDYYHDPSLPDSVPTFQYTAVKTDYPFPEGIEYEIIDVLYIPEEDKIFNYENGGAEDCFVDQLLNQAYLQTGNIEDIIDLKEDCGQTLSARRYTPGGRIRVFDTRLQQWIGMEGVRVQARRWFIWYNGYPDYNGNYRMNHSFKRPCNYSIWFARETFSVRHNLVNTTYWINGPKISGDWNYDLNNGYQRFAGHVFRGAFRYHAKDIGGLQRPWIPFKRQVYVAKDGYKDWSGVNWIVLPVIRIARYQTEVGEYDSDEIFSTTCHETGHTSHVLRMNGGVIQFWQVTTQLQESWPVALEWFLSHKEYAERGIANYGEWNYIPTNPPQYPNRQAYQYWTLGVSHDYTSLYINLVDAQNDRTLWGLTASPDDQVTGYTLPFIEQKILKHSYGLTSLSTQLMNNKPAGVTDAQIKLLISFY